ncbi:MAG: metal ABC transporter ATP-binding protein [Pseudomonadota bacterium]
MAAIQFDNLTLGYGRHPAVHHLDGQLRSGSLTAVVGPNGAGKSTLLKGVVGALKPLEGQVRFNHPTEPEIAYLPQLSELDRQFPITVRELVNFGLWRRTGLFGGLRRFRGVVTNAIAAVGLTGFETRAINSLSGGQLQRALFARLLVQDARVIVLDEPFNSMDSRTASDLMAMVQRWHGEERTVLVVLHDLDLVREQFPDTLLISRQLIGLGATPEVLTAENLLRARQLHEAFDDNAGVCDLHDAA